MTHKFLNNAEKYRASIYISWLYIYDIYKCQEQKLSHIINSVHTVRTFIATHKHLFLQNSNWRKKKKRPQTSWSTEKNLTFSAEKLHTTNKDEKKKL